MEFIFQYAWLLLIFVTLLNVYLLKNRFSKFIAEKPERKEGYNLIIKNFTIYSLIPWIIVAIGCLSGETESVFDYFEPAKLNPFVLAFHFSVIVIWIMMIRFVYFKNGAEFLENHPGLIRVNSLGKVDYEVSRTTIKIFTALAIAGGIVALVIMWNIEFPNPFFK